MVKTGNKLVEVMDKQVDKPPLLEPQDKNKHAAGNCSLLLQEPGSKRIKLRHDPFFHIGHKFAISTLQ